MKTFWRDHSQPRPKPYQQRRGNGGIVPQSGSVESIRAVIRRLEQNPTTNGAPRARFAFMAADVAEIYMHKDSEGAGVWFRLKSGQIINQHGEPDGTNPAGYSRHHMGETA
jgi:hypothetical protein